MQPNKSKIALIIGAMYLGVSGASFAASESFTITAATIADVTLTETVSMDFGSNVFTTTGTCVMDVDTPGDVDMQLATTGGTGTTASSSNASYGLLSGTSCVVGEAGTPGVYKVAGSQGADVSVTLNGVTETDYSFAPVGVIGNYFGGASADDDDTIVALTSGNAYGLASTLDAAETSGVVVAGELVFVLGGTLTLTNALTANTAYASTFVVNVVY